jgi:hypothetical protein
MGWQNAYNNVEHKIINDEPLSIHEVMTEGQKQVLELPIEDRDIVCVSGELSDFSWSSQYTFASGSFAISGAIPTTQAIYTEEDEEISPSVIQGAWSKLL